MEEVEVSCRWNGHTQDGKVRVVQTATRHTEEQTDSGTARHHVTNLLNFNTLLLGGRLLLHTDNTTPRPLASHIGHLLTDNYTACRRQTSHAPDCDLILIRLCLELGLCLAVLDLDKLHVEDEVRLGRDDGRETVLAWCVSSDAELASEIRKWSPGRLSRHREAHGVLRARALPSPALVLAHTSHRAPPTPPCRPRCPTLTVSHVVWDGEDTPLADAHVLKALVPALDDLAGADCRREVNQDESGGAKRGLLT